MGAAASKAHREERRSSCGRDGSQEDRLSSRSFAQGGKHLDKVSSCCEEEDDEEEEAGEGREEGPSGHAGKVEFDVGKIQTRTAKVESDVPHGPITRDEIKEDDKEEGKEECKEEGKEEGKEE